MSWSAASGTAAFPVNEIAETAHSLDDGDEDERQQERDHGDCCERWREAEFEEAENLHGHRCLAWPREKDRQVDVRERMDEREHGTRNHTRLDQRKYDVAERCQPRRT